MPGTDGEASLRGGRHLQRSVVVSGVRDPALGFGGVQAGLRATGQVSV